MNLYLVSDGDYGLFKCNGYVVEQKDIRKAMDLLKNKGINEDQIVINRLGTPINHEYLG